MDLIQLVKSDNTYYNRNMKFYIIVIILILFVIFTRIITDPIKATLVLLLMSFGIYISGLFTSTCVTAPTILLF